MHKPSSELYFDLNSVIESSRFFEYGKVPYRILKLWYYPASQICKVRKSGNDPQVLFIKMLKRRNDQEICKHEGLIEKEYNILRLMHEKCDSSDYDVVEPLECIKSKLALITKGEEGRRLDQILLNIRPFGPVGLSQILEGITAAGMWLRCLYESTKLFRNDHHISKGILEEMDAGLKIIRSYKKGREWDSWEELLLSHVYAQMNSIEGRLLQESLCHGDFTPGNILLSRSGKTVVLDLTDSSRGVIYNDLAAFWQWLDELGRRRPWYRENKIEEMKSHLLKGFFHGEIPPTLMNIFIIKKGIGTICRLVQKGSHTFLEDFMKERRIVYWRRKLLMMAANA